MAISARDLYFAVRVEDRASRPLRRIAADFKSLGKSGLASRQADLSAAKQFEARAERARRNAAQQYLASKRAAELNTNNARRAESAAANARRNAATDFMTARRTLGLKSASAKLSVDNARLARRNAAADFLSARSGATKLQQERATAQAILTASRAKLAGIGISAKAESITAAELKNAELLDRYARGKGFPKGVSKEGKAQLLGAAQAGQRAIQTRRSMLPIEGQVASAALTEQTKKLRELDALEASHAANRIALGQRLRAASDGYRLAQSKQVESEIAGSNRVTRARNSLRSAVAAYGAAQARTIEVETVAQERVSRSANTLRNASVAYRNAGQKVEEANQAIDEMPAQELQLISRTLRDVGKGLALVGTIGVLSFAALGKSAADYSTEVTLAATQSTTLGHNSVMQVQKNAAFIQKEIQKLMASGRVIASSKEQTGAVYQIFSGLTLKGGQLSQLRQGIKLLKEFNDVTTANVGLVTLEETTKAGIILMNNFGYTAANVRKGLNTMQAAVRFGRITMSEFISTLNQAAPAAKSAHYSFTQMAGSIAFLSRKFPSVATAATGYARLTEQFGKQTVIDGLKKQNVQILDSHKNLLPLNVIIQKLIKAFPQLASGGTYAMNFFKNISGAQATGSYIAARRVFTQLVQDSKGYDKVLGQVARDQNELKKSLLAAQASPGVKWKEFTIQLKAFALEVGTGVLPAVGNLADHVKKLAQWFNDLSPHTKQMIGYFGMLISVGTVLGGVLFYVVGGAIALGVAVRGLLAVTGLLGAETGLASVQFAALFGAAAILIAVFIKYPGILHAITNALGGTKAAIETLVLLMAAQKFGLFSSVIAQAIAATGAVTTLQVALATLGAIGTVVVTIIVIRKLLNEKGSPLHGGVSREANNFFGDFKKNLQHPLDIHRSVRVIIDGIAVLGNHNAGKQAELDLKNKIDSLGTIDSGSGKKAQVDMRRQFDIKPHIRHEQDQTKNAAAAFGVVATPSFKKLFAQYVAAAKALEKLKKSGHASIAQLFVAEQKVATASANLSANADKQKVAAAKKAAADLLRNGNNTAQKFSDAHILAEEKNVLKLEKIAKKAKTLAAWKTYYAAVDKLSKDATSSQLQAVERLFEKIPKDAKKSADKTAKALKAAYSDVLGNLKSSYDSFLSQNQSAFGELFQGPFMKSPGMQESLDWNYQLKTGDLLKDLRQQVNGFKNWRHEINDLRKRGLPKSLLDEIMKLGPDQAGDQVKLLKKMTPAQIAEYKRLWLAGQKQIHKATMNDLKAQLDDWRRHGKRIALAIARGLKDENLALENALAAMIGRVFPSLKKAAKIVPIKPNEHKSTPNVAGTKSAPRYQSHGEKQTVVKNDHVHYHITTTGHKDDVKKQARDAHWQHRTRYGK